MKTEKQHGYVIIKKNGEILSFTFRQLKKDCISNFIKDSGSDWNFWKNKFGFKCVNANQIIELNQ